MANPFDRIWCIVGYIDAYGAIHHRAFSLQDYRDDVNMRHDHLFPMQTHKLWRFYTHKWRLEDSSLSLTYLTREEREDVIEYVNKRFSQYKKEVKSD